MTPTQLRAWQSRLNYTNVEAASALGISLSGYVQMRMGVHRTTGRELSLDKRTALACAALEMIAEQNKPGSVKKMTRANLYATLNISDTQMDVVLNTDQAQAYKDHAYALLVELTRVANDSIDPDCLIGLVNQDPFVATHSANALNQTILELENMVDPWVIRNQLLHAYKKEAQILWSILARNAGNAILEEIGSKMEDQK